MTRKYLNDRWCVRCGRTDPTPYLRKHIERFSEFNQDADWNGLFLDLGCGNGRNTLFMRSSGMKCLGVDMAGDFGIKLELGKDPFPSHYFKSVSGFLINYSLMFLDLNERGEVYKEIARCAAKTCLIIIELYPAKDSHCPDNESMRKIHEEARGFLSGIGFNVLHESITKKSTHILMAKCSEVIS